MSDQEWDIEHYLTPRELNTAWVFVTDDSFLLSCPTCGSDEMNAYMPVKYVHSLKVEEMKQANDAPRSWRQRLWMWLFPEPELPKTLPYGYVRFKTDDVTLQCVACDDTITVPDGVKFMADLSVGDIYVG
jgi:hypothetical protein